ncbi:CHAP domain-containing protein [Nocardioides sp. W7]|uniref:CHAP domain-containing protein n=1 Tax=Nocardioides sp. W7 TaxID=2931390 RepID=UPI001FD1AA4D|nr:CHAP domain-containing protein [Nocardioides sp. W7]
MHHQSQEPRRPHLAAVIGLLVLLGGLLVLPAPAATAASTYLCTGYSGCANAGYSHAGYRKARTTMYWQMYAGHNCTNYAAYRVVKNGMANSRPWNGNGNASNWGVAMSRITDAKPMVGAIAWWKANVPGAGASGHVAYVEQVVSSTEIVISEDSWGGDFHWRRITKSGRGWPSGFIHFNDKVLAPTSPPSVLGTPQIGATLTANQGAWNPAGTYSYQWAVAGTPIAGATAQTYSPTADVLRKPLSVTVTVTKNGYQPGRAVASTAAVAPGTMANPVPPAITGTPQVDETLQVSLGTWSPAPVTTAVKWYADGVVIPGATGPSLTLTQAHIDKQITANVSARATAYNRGTVATAPTTPILAGTIREVTPYTLSGATGHGRVLTVTPGTLEPADSTATYTWLRDGVPIPGATGATYRLGAADVGSRVSLRLDVVRRSFRSLSRTIRIGSKVTTRPTMKVVPKGQAGRAIVTVRLRAPGIDPFKGRVTVRIGSRSEVVRIVDGKARVAFTGLRPGVQAIQVRYTGTSVIKPVKGKGRVRIPSS